MQKLTVAGLDGPLAVQSFHATHALQELFHVEVIVSADPGAMDFEALLGERATFEIGDEGAPAGRRRFAGICARATRRGLDARGLATWEVTIVPTLWLLGQRVRRRIFQHRSAPDIVSTIVREAGASVALRVDPRRHPRLEVRVQYDESDLAFATRILEEAGITFTVETSEGGEESVVLNDAIEARDPALEAPVLVAEGATGPADAPHLADVRVVHELRPTRVALLGFDPDRRPSDRLGVTAKIAGVGAEQRMQRTEYAPTAFVREVEGPVPERRRLADGKGLARADERFGAERAERRLLGLRSGARALAFSTNLRALEPGHTLAVRELPPGLGRVEKLLVVEVSMRGDGGALLIEGRAVSAHERFYPPVRTPKPIVRGIEHATVVGPAGEEIHTDELGRVRVQFPWDAEGRFDDESSCWIRVVQPAAGASLGMVSIPRVGQEVVVAFFDGDPDAPVIVGRLSNETCPLPLDLPSEKAVSVWRGQSSPGGEGHNEIRLDDGAGAELVSVHAERNLEILVRNDRRETVLGARELSVEGSDRTEVGEAQSLLVKKDRMVTVAGSDDLVAGESLSIMVTPPTSTRRTGMEVSDGKLSLTNGQASITLDAGSIAFEAPSAVTLAAGGHITVRGRATIDLAGESDVKVRSRFGELVLSGGPDVRINPDPFDPSRPPEDLPREIDLDEAVLEAERASLFDASDPAWLERQLAPGGAWDPKRFGEDKLGAGYFYVGVLSTASGVPLPIVMRRLGRMSMDAGEAPDDDRGDPGSGPFGGRYPYGNDPAHLDHLRWGAAYHARGYAPFDPPEP